MQLHSEDMTIPIKAPKKLIEVALPLDIINEAAGYEKLPGIGAHPRGLHQWWARRPLTAARAVLFAQLVNDPGFERHLGRGVNKEKAAAERERLFKLIERLCQWANTHDEPLMAAARAEILKSWQETCALNRNHPQASELFNPEKLPAFHDPFAGGGALPLEAQRLGLESYASDLNPVAVTINKAMIEIPARFAGLPPVGPIPKAQKQSKLIDDWRGARGLAEDVRRYGAWILEKLRAELGEHYPDVNVTDRLIAERPILLSRKGQRLDVVAWLWARTVLSPNPAFSDVHVPLVSSYVLSRKAGQGAYVTPVIEGKSYRFVVRVGAPEKDSANGTKASSRGANFRCLLSDVAISAEYIKQEAMAGRLGARLLAIVADGPRGRVYLSPTADHEAAGLHVHAKWKPDIEFFQAALGFRVGNYGMSKWSELFTQRQLTLLSTLGDLILQARDSCEQSAQHYLSKDERSLNEGGAGALAYSQAVTTYLSFAMGRIADFNNALCGWNPSNEKVMHLFGRQAIPMVWDFAEANALADVVGGWSGAFDWEAACIATLDGTVPGYALQADASAQSLSKGKVIATDPPYFDNIGYADLSDFFYVWLRRVLRDIYPPLFGTLAVPKAEELVATPARHGGKEQAEAFFLSGMTKAMHALAEQAHPAFPVSIYYAFKQSDTESEGETSSTGWETFLEAVIRAGFAITGTWPLRSEQTTRMRGMSSNALASSILLVCRRSESNASSVSRREFLRELNAVLPDALAEMTRGGVSSPVAPVDLSQAIIGPGMAIFSQYAAVLEADGSPMDVRTALTLINRFLAEDDFDHETQFCLHWFDGYGWGAGKYGDADVLARAKGTSVAGIADAGVVESGGGNVRLFRYAEYPTDWSPAKDVRTPIWEALHHMIRALQSDGEAGAGRLLADMPARAEPIRALAYRLYTLCERKGWAEEARAYNELITSWTGIEGASQEVGHIGTQVKLDI